VKRDERKIDHDNEPAQLYNRRGGYDCCCGNIKPRQSRDDSSTEGE
jgi:hypothetical protein